MPPRKTAPRKETPPLDIRQVNSVTGLPREGILKDVAANMGHRMKATGSSHAILRDDGTQYSLASQVSTLGVRTKVGDQPDYVSTYWGWHGIVQPEYNILEPYTILDTEGYYYRALKRQHSLMFRMGWEVVGGNQTFVSYLERRLRQLGYVSPTSFKELVKQILWNLLVCSNCIVLKLRDPKLSGGRQQQANGNRPPIAGLTLIPTHTIYPYLDGYGKIIAWRRTFGKALVQDYDVADVIHFYWDRKPGHIFGTPRLSPVRDDIFSLRRLEENAELLLYNHLLPTYHVKIGTDKSPATTMADGRLETEYMQSKLDSMPRGGAFVTDHRTQIEALGAKQSSLDPMPLITYYKARIFSGLGVSPVDMGESAEATKSSAEEVSQNLKDHIKADQEWFSDQISQMLFRELFQEAPFALSVQNAVQDVQLEFHEVDIDNRIKTENHSLALYNSHQLAGAEMRRVLKRKPMTEDELADTHYSRHVHSLAMDEIDEKGKWAIRIAREGKQQPGGEAPVRGNKRKKSPASHGAKGVTTKDQPRNQHGVNLDPHKKRSSRSELPGLWDKLQNYRADKDGPWEIFVASAYLEHVTEDTNNRYRGSVRGDGSLMRQLQACQDPDTLFALINCWKDAEDAIEDAIEEHAPELGAYVPAAEHTAAESDPSRDPDSPGGETATPEAA